MILSNFTYKELDGWQLDGLLLNHLNLIVALNATGKTKTINAISNVIRLIKGEQSDVANSFSCSLTFKNSGLLKYSFEVVGGKIASETLSKDDTMLIQRAKNKAVIKDDEINPPESKLILQIRRDTIKYPEFEKIIQWAEYTFVFIFSNITNSPNSLSPYAVSQEPKIPSMYEAIPEAQRQSLIDNMRSLDYPIDNIKSLKTENGAKMLYIYESGVNTPMTPFDLSNGMFRVFCILLYMTYCSSLTKARCLIIDDMGEGLDYVRSERLGKIMFDYCLKNDIQLIVTSNDSFLTNVVDLEYLNILQRNGNKVNSLNSTTDKDLFRKFARTGLNNFDMLSSNFIISNQN
ncbi:MAG: ATP-binding protein [Bacteroidales bacterium]|nr:ATP-binding protein [Bacteroidales bacterium]